MGHGHGHSHGHGSAAEVANSASSKYLKKLILAVLLGTATLVIQFITALYTNSLALLSDSAHVFTDVFGVSMTIVAIVVAHRAVRSPGQTYGLYRAEVMAALANTVLLFGAGFWVLYEALSRIHDPRAVPGLPVLLVGAISLLGNGIAFLILREGAGESLNVQGACLEVMSDMLGSLGVLISGLLIWTLHWHWADPLIAVTIGLFVLPRAWSLGRDALRILIQQAPQHLDVGQVARDLGLLPGVRSVSDLHVWTLTSGMDVASAHLTVERGSDYEDVLHRAKRLLAEQYRIGNTTLQIQPELVLSS
ncbi:cation transporter [Pseudonocardiaceae bacterium YIM PH 21723]|nr:cation transporter [Pseudonocardiaceae bacterium YIM PH 21723]